MRKMLALKTVLRTPLKTLLTFLLMAVASFTLFLRVTDYAITSKETAKVKGSYYGVAALDNSAPSVIVQGDGWAELVETTNSWPSDGQLEEFAALPGVTLADTRYMTAGLVEDYKRLHSEADKAYWKDRCILEGTYVGNEDVIDDSGSAYDKAVMLKFGNVTMLAGEMESGVSQQVKIQAPTYDIPGEKSHTREFYDRLEKGSRCLIVAESRYGSGELNMEFGEDKLCVLDESGEGYLETEEFSYYKELVNAINQGAYTYDIVYTADTRAIPCFNEGGMEIAKGRGLTREDTDVCVVNELLLETYGLSIGDKLSIRLGDVLFHQRFNGIKGASEEVVSEFGDTVELEIVGVYRILDDIDTRASELRWSYDPSTVFVPSSLFSAEVPQDYETNRGEFSVLVENVGDIRAFRDAAELFAEEMGVNLRFSDGGWLNIEESFETAQAASLLTVILYIVGAALALLLAVYLYIGRNGQAYAIMLALGVPGRRAGNSILLPFAVLSLLAMPIGGIAGMLYASKAAGALGDIPSGYVPDMVFPARVVCGCLFFEVAFLIIISLCFLWRMKKTPPLDLLTEQHTCRRGFRAKAGHGNMEGIFYTAGALMAPDRFEVGKLPDAGEMLHGRKYGTLYHVSVYVLRHKQRDIGKTVVSLLLAIVLLSGIGMFTLARLTYQDAAHSIDVKGKALQFSSASITELTKSDLMEGFYYYGSFHVYINGVDQESSMVFTNDLERYLAGSYTVNYADGYDISSLQGTGALCLMGSGIAETLGVGPGDNITLLAYNNYAAWASKIKDKEKLEEEIQGQTQEYTVAGIVESSNEVAGSSIFASINYSSETLYRQPFPILHSEFILSDNGKLDEMEELLAGKQDADRNFYSPMASFQIESDSLKDIEHLCGLLEELFPIAVVSVLLVGLIGQGLVIMQSAKEAALLRVLGVTKRRVRCMLVLGQVFLCLAGILLVAGGLYLYSPGQLLRSSTTLAACFGLYFIGCVLGASIAAVQVTRHKILELLQVKE